MSIFYKQDLLNDSFVLSNDYECFEILMFNIFFFFNSVSKVYDQLNLIILPNNIWLTLLWKDRESYK